MDDIRVYQGKNALPVVIDGIDSHTYVSGDLLAEELNGKIIIKRTKNLNAKVLFKYDFNVFKNEKGENLGSDLQTTISELNNIFSKTEDDIIDEVFSNLKKFTSRTDAIKALGPNKIYILQVKSVLGDIELMLAVT